MHSGLKIFLYIVFIVGACLSGFSFVNHYRRLFAEPAEVSLSKTNAITASANEAAASTNEAGLANEAVAGTTEATAATNEVAAPANESLTASNEVATATDSSAPPENQPGPAKEEIKTELDHSKSGGYANLVIFTGLFFLSVIGVGVLVGNDVSHFFGNRALKFLYNDEGEGFRDPEYEQAEQEWADGNHLEAIRLMRDYLKKYPREQHAALRIAEIYENDLHNYLAAALEYEEILTKKLPAERWGWSAIHLCNLYVKLDQQEKAVALLRRIDAEYSETAAAAKARQRLAMYDGGEQSAINEEPSPPA